MNRDQLGLAQEALNIYQRDYSPEYALLREKLAGSMAVDGMLLDEMRFQRESIYPNTELVNNLVGTLPPTANNTNDRHDDSFTLKDAYTARALENNLAWVRQPIAVDTRWDSVNRKDVPVYVTRLKPFYIVGERPSPEQEGTTQLLLSATPETGRYKYDEVTKYDQDKFFTVTVSSKEKALAEQVTAEHFGQPYTEAQMKAMFDGRSLRFGVENMAGFVQRHFKRPRNSDKLEARVRQQGGINIGDLQPLEEGLTDDLMTQFGVMDRLNRLAAAFSKVSELQGLLIQHAEKARPNPLAKSLEAKVDTEEQA